ncbi:hypothetical protein HPB50_014803 [Hyalomma asiaticum]|uniref:Uncharacterized protein n=1 Tax=Hyalomma asiaticum TaxID=266040 RepID=A0ACB7SFU7_HYAAI|nr:hypothetical protein HPB50_014803 [Hyalomma asiaticum]
MPDFYESETWFTPEAPTEPQSDGGEDVDDFSDSSLSMYEDDSDYDEEYEGVGYLVTHTVRQLDTSAQQVVEQIQFEDFAGEVFVDDESSDEMFAEDEYGDEAKCDEEPPPDAECNSGDAIQPVEELGGHGGLFVEELEVTTVETVIAARVTRPDRFTCRRAQ